MGRKGTNRGSCGVWNGWVFLVGCWAGGYACVLGCDRVPIRVKVMCGEYKGLVRG